MPSPSPSSPSPSVYPPELWDQLRAAPPLYAVLGFPVAHSLSPAFQLAGFEAVNRPAQYVRIEVPENRLREAVSRLVELGSPGWNCTLPLKIDMFNMVDETSAAARAMQAVNTVVHRTDGTLFGDNTDGVGWRAAIVEEFGVHVRDLRIMLLGLGGAGRGIATQAAIEECAGLVLVNRSQERAREVAQQIAPYYPAERLQVLPWEEASLARALQEVDLVVNATSCGLRADDPPVLPAKLLLPRHLVYDTIYKPAQTGLLREAERAGARIANGLSMLLHQGAASFRLWTGQEPPLNAMRAGLVQAVASVS